MKITFLGTGGGYCSNIGFTSSVYVECKNQDLILDAGAGMMRLQKKEFKKPVSLFLSHFHLDHTSSIHALQLFNFQKGLTIYGQKGTEKKLKSFFRPPFSNSLAEIKFPITFKELNEGRHSLNNLKVACYYLKHNDPCFGYRFEEDEKSFAYCIDTLFSQNSIKLAKNADVLIHDGSFKTTESLGNWAHSTPEIAVRVAKNSGAKKLYLTHFVPLDYGTKKEKKDKEREVQKLFKNTFFASDLKKIIV